MANHQLRIHYERQTHQNYHPTNNIPLRAKAFSHLDNLPLSSNNTHTQDHSPNSQNVDKIAEIKKKYDKLLSKGVSKQNQTSENLPTEHNRSISGLENKKREQYNRATISVHYGLDKNAVRNFEKPSTPIKRQTYSRDYVPKTQQKKSTLEQNRVNLSAMKSELQARLNELSAKTIMNSSIRQRNHDLHEFTVQPIIKPTKQENYLNYGRVNSPLIACSEKLTHFPSKNIQKQDFSNKYDKILLKYKQQLQKPSRQQQTREERSKLQEKNQEISCLSQYMNASKNGKYGVNKQQLSVISEKSNSNNSEIVVENSIQIQDKLKENTQIKMSYVRQVVDVRSHNIFRKDVDQSLMYKKERQGQQPFSYENKQTQKKANLTANSSNFTNASEYSKYKNFQAPSNPQVKNKEDNQKQKQFYLKKLENNVGPIKRTTTQQHFMNFNKANILQSRDQIKGKQQSANKYANSMSKNKDLTKIQSSKYGLHLDVQLGEATFGKKTQKQSYPVYQATPTISSHQKSTNQIQKLKQRYAKSTHAVTSSNHDKSTSKLQAESQPSKKPAWKNYQFKDNQQISNKIDRLDKKIKQIESNKKNLNISFQPFQGKITTKNPSNNEKSALKYDKNDLSQKYNNKHRNQENKSAVYHKEEDINPRARVSSYYQRVRPIYSDITLPDASKTQINGFSIRLMPVQIDTEQSRTLNECSFSELNSKSQIKQQFIKKMQFQLKADTGIEERKRKLKDKVQNSNNIKNLVKIFGQQAVFDEIFRNNKIWFASQRQQSKWQNLHKELKNYNISLTESQIKFEFQLAQSQNNPFFSISDSKCDTKTLVSSYNQAKRHWQEKLYKKFDRISLQRQGLNSSKIDFDKKGFILIQDMVRFFNIQSGTFLRNRDVSIIFKRINKASDKISFDELMEAVSK